MSARALIQAAVVARLRATAALAGVGVFDGAPARATLPFAQLDEPVLADWSTATWTGCEARLALTIRDAGENGGERPARLRGLVDAAEAAILSLPAELGVDEQGSWRVASLMLARSRIVRVADRWTGTSEFRLRLYAAG